MLKQYKSNSINGIPTQISRNSNSNNGIPAQISLILASGWSRAMKTVTNIDESVFRMPIYPMLSITNKQRCFLSLINTFNHSQYRRLPLNYYQTKVHFV